MEEVCYDFSSEKCASELYYCLICSVCVCVFTGCPSKECARLREGVPYVTIYRYNPKHLYPKLNGYGDNGQRSLKL